MPKILETRYTQTVESFLTASFVIFLNVIYE